MVKNIIVFKINATQTTIVSTIFKASGDLNISIIAPVENTNAKIFMKVAKHVYISMSIKGFRL